MRRKRRAMPPLISISIRCIHIPRCYAYMVRLHLDFTNWWVGEKKALLGESQLIGSLRVFS